MKIKRGSIYLVDFGIKYQSELGKIRPALVLQSDYINENLDIAPFKSVLVIPLTTDLKDGKFRQKIVARDQLKKDSELLINWMCTVDLNRFKNDTVLTTLTPEEFVALKSKLDFFMGYLDL